MKRSKKAIDEYMKNYEKNIHNMKKVQLYAEWGKVRFEINKDAKPEPIVEVA